MILLFNVNMEKNSLQENLLFTAEDHARLKARRRESQRFFTFSSSFMFNLATERAFVRP